MNEAPHIVASPGDSKAYVAPQPGTSRCEVPPLRWLAEQCGVKVLGVPLPRLFSELLREEEHLAKTLEYVAWWMRNPDEGSSFESILKPLSALPDHNLIQVLQQRNYDGLCYLVDGEIVGHVFFQNHEREICAFSASVSQEQRGGKLWLVMAFDLMDYAARVKDVCRTSIGTGRHPMARLLIREFARHTPTLGWKVTHDGWIEFASPHRDTV